MTRFAFGFAITTAALTTGEALAQTPPPSSSVPQSLLQIELAAPQGVLLKIRPEMPENDTVYDFVTCPPACRLTLYPGRYRVEGEPPTSSGLRQVESTVDVWKDARIDVAAGDRGEHDWGMGLTIGGGVLFGLGTLLYAIGNMPTHPHSSVTDKVSYIMMGTGAPITVGGIYMLVHSRNRVAIEETRQGSTPPASAPRESHIDIGWRF